MNQEIMFSTNEVVDFINTMKTAIREELENGNTNKAVEIYNQMWVLADFGVYSIHNATNKNDFLNLIKTAADDIRVEIRKAQTKDFYQKEDEVLNWFKSDMEGRLEDNPNNETVRKIIITIGKKH